MDITALTSKQVRRLTTEELKAADVELARRAVALGRPGVVSKAHRVVLKALAGR